MNTRLLNIAARVALRMLAVMVLMAGVLTALPGCGGGDWEEDPATSTTPTPPNCQERPEICR